MQELDESTSTSSAPDLSNSTIVNGYNALMFLKTSGLFCGVFKKEKIAVLTIHRNTVLDRLIPLLDH